MRRFFVPLAVFCLACGAGTETPPEPAPETSRLVQPEGWWSILPRPGYVDLEKIGLFGDWFEVYRLAEGTYAIYEPFQFQEAISYLVLGEERAALVDSGNGIGEVREVVEQLTELPVTVLLTHEHPDHFGGADAFSDIALFGDPRATERLGAGVANEVARGWITGEQVWQPLPSGVTPESFSVPAVTPTRLLEDGETIELGGRTIEVIHTPGHSPGSVCYLDRERRLLFTGDHFYPGPLWAFGDDVDLDAYLASNDRLVARLDDYDHVLPGHNEPWVDAAVIPAVSAAFRTIRGGGGEYSEDGRLRRYRFEGFDVIVKADPVAP